MSGESPAPPAGPKAIASLAKKPSDVTRQGTQKLKFVPTLPNRRKKEETKDAPQSSAAAQGRGRGRGRGGEGRGAAPRPPPAEMTASGPFAMGPALAGPSARRTGPRSSFTPVAPKGPESGSALGANLSSTAAPTLKRDKQHENPLVDLAQTARVESDEEVYSEPDEGVEIIDMKNVRQLDWMAPETLQRERRDKRRKKGVVKTETEDDQGPSAQTLKADPSNALDLSESEEEDELENLVDDFAIETHTDELGTRQERLYFFQFPEPFPSFASTLVPTAETSGEMDIDSPDPGPSGLKRKVSFAANTKSPLPGSGTSTPMAHDAPETLNETVKVDGVIGHMEVYRSGMVKMRLGNGIVLNVSEGTQPSFLQQAVHLDTENKKLHILGEVNKRFVVSPDLDTLLASMEFADATTLFDDTDLVKMGAV